MRSISRKPLLAGHKLQVANSHTQVASAFLPEDGGEREEVCWQEIEGVFFTLMTSSPSLSPPVRRRHLTTDERAAIAQERAHGVRVQDLARRWGVSRQTIHATLRAASGSGQGGAQAAPAPRSPMLSARVPIREARALDAMAAAWGVSRAEALRRLMREAQVMLAPDGAATAQLASMAAAVHEAGVQVNEIAKTCNEASARRQPIPYTIRQEAQVRRAVGLVFDTIRQVQALAERGRARRDAITTAALGTKGAPQDEP